MATGAAAGNSSLTVVDAATRRAVKEIPVGAKPRGVVLPPWGTAPTRCA